MISPAVTKKPMFWLLSLVFLLAIAGISVYLLPPQISKSFKITEEKTALEQKLNEQKMLVSNINELAKNQDKLEQLHTKALYALPTEISADILLLQLEELATSLGIREPKLTVPFGQGIGAASSVSTADPALNQPIVKGGAGAAGQATFSISGEIDFPALKNLLVSLRNLPRWNQITSVDITRGSEAITANITAQIFTSVASTKNYTGTNPNLLEQANKLFDDIQIRRLAPDADQEGTFGKVNPFN